MNEEEKKCEESEGAPAWVMTFADLMSLLMCFFVLLLSFSEMDVQKFKQIAGSMKFAFGVQREIEAPEPPKGTSVIAQEFSPNITEPTPIPEVRQQTTDEVRTEVEIRDIAREEAEAKAEELKEALAAEIGEGLVEVDAVEDEVLIRIREKGSFPSGTAELRPSFLPVLDRIGRVLAETDGQIVVAGHTDNIPIATRQFPSNWVLSAARAANVVHYLSKTTAIDPARMEIRAHAETQPLIDNDTVENRAENRRVEIILRRSDATASDFGESTEVLEILQQPSVPQ